MKGDSPYVKDLAGALKLSKFLLTLRKSLAVMLLELSYANALMSRCFTY